MAVVALAAAPAAAQVHKCKGADGAPVFQSAPCDDRSGGIAVPERGADKGKGAKPAEADKKAMNEAFRSRMDKRDYEGALAFATTDQQKSQARRKIAEKDARCRGLAVKLQEAQAKYDKDGGQSKAALDKAKSNYAKCT
jgi:hypothetical protein